MTAEIKRLARQQIASDGATNLSLRAVSREIGTSCSALYRYFPSRDHLLTALIIDTYDELGAAIELAVATVDRSDLRARWSAVAHGLRNWALAHPADYGLIFGTPVPGYEAPPDTIGPATRYTDVLVQFLADLHASGARTPITIVPSGDLTAQYDALRARLGHDIPDDLLLAGLTAWMNLFGAIGFEVFGQLHNVLNEPGTHFAALVDLLAVNVLGIPD